MESSVFPKFQSVHSVHQILSWTVSVEIKYLIHTHFSMSSFQWNNGTYVWAKTDRRYWPAIIVSHHEAHMRELKEDLSVYVYWFGDKRISEVPKKSLLDFKANFEYVFKQYKKQMGQTWYNGVFDAIRSYGKKKTKNMSKKKLIEFAKNSFREAYDTDDDEDLEEIPAIIRLSLNEREYIKWRPYISSKNTGNLQKIHLKNISHIACIACYSFNLYGDHPLFEGKLCEDCFDKLQHTTNVFDKDGTYKYCSVCGNFGNIITCENSLCKRVFCGQCIKHLEITHGLQQKTWFCPFCSKYKYLRPGRSWVSSLQAYLSTTIEEYEVETLPFTNIRILNMFHGYLKTLINVFPQLKTHKVDCTSIDEDYFGSSYVSNIEFEYLSTSLIAVTKNFCNFYSSNLVKFQNMTELKSEHIWEINGLNFMCGGSSISLLELQSYNYAAPMELFFEFYRIYSCYKTYLQSIRHEEIHWLFELPCSISKETRDYITNFMKCQPILVRHEIEVNIPDSIYQIVWTNVPKVQ